MTNRPNRLLVVGIVGANVALIASISLAQPAQSTSSAGASETGCGVLALTTLLNLEGRAVTTHRVAACLPDRPAHSLAELQATARTLGCSLVGVRLDRQRWPLDRPALVHLDKQGVGHFVVIRAVGSTGQLVQSIDPIRGVEVQEVAAVFGSKEWTGVALVPSRWADFLSLTSAVLIVPPVGLMVFLLGHGWRRDREQRPAERLIAGGEAGLGSFGHRTESFAIDR